MQPPNDTLRSGNRLQRAYYRWALPHYERMPPELRAQTEAIDRLLYSRRGLGIWTGWLCGLAGTTAGVALGMGLPWLPALGISLLLWVGITLGGLSAWLRPEAMLRLKSARPILGLLAAGLLAGAPTGFVIGHWVKHGSLELGLLGTRLWAMMSSLAPAFLLGGLGVALVFWTLAIASQQATQRRLDRSQLLAERDAAARGAAEAHLRLLQAQIQPHFVFNTLATLQHWVDKHDERAGPLLRELTGFLRSSTDMLGRSTVPLSDEVQAVRHYLAILQARLGARLRCELSIDPALSSRPLPAGMLLTLVENAIEHGLEPRIGSGQLWVSAQPAPGGWRLQVDDDGVGLPSQAIEGVGLSNVRQRLQHHFGAGASLILQPRAAGGTRACIHIPDEAHP